LLVLVYIGGMLIIFLFSTVLRAERYPESGWQEFMIFWPIVCLLSYPFLKMTWAVKERGVSQVVLIKESGLGTVFGDFGIYTCVVAFILLVALIVVLVLGFEHGRETLRKL
jgi:NADH:ubiquinone oxidoreductase subunit 6 (subunit J)